MTIKETWDTKTQAFIQWKGTDVCMDIHCPSCGAHNHYDTDFCYTVSCGSCGIVMEMSTHVSFRVMDPEETKGREGFHRVGNVD